MTAALEILPADRRVLEVFDRHRLWEAPPCLICGGEGGPECVHCLLDHDQAMRRAEDI